MKSLQLYKKIIKWVFWGTIVLIIFLTLQAIYETDNWKLFDIDFNTRDHIISAYGSLIGGVLAFLSILFVLYQVYEQREQILNEKQEKEDEKIQDLKDRLLLLINYLKTLDKDIIAHGKRMVIFFKAEQGNPAMMNTIYFNVNKNFERVLEMDVLSNFKAFQHFFDNTSEDWQKLFINLYELAEFYNEAFKDLKKKYELHINDKVKTMKGISLEMNNMLTANGRLIDDYRAKYGSENYLKYSWSKIVNEYTPTHYNYLKETEQKGELPDFRYISDNLLLPFIEDAMEIRSAEGFDEMGSRDIIEKASTIRKKIWEAEVYSLQYAEDIEKQYNFYFKSDNETLKELNDIKEKIESLV